MQLLVYTVLSIKFLREFSFQCFFFHTIEDHCKQNSVQNYTFLEIESLFLSKYAWCYPSDYQCALAG